ncbi:PKD domain-containing protein [Methanosarcina sp.]|uniref:PKD domain-containing protein n=1 Tax=Methanosarcina sp. TaxID=2213 RepID=UPI002ABA908A|nr:PKD domain-containing protein [Methanosarcina sp.]MDY9926298.1 PKD domain-containing protein [Methanosarcina sp.]
MIEPKCDKTRKRRVRIKVLGIMVLVLLMLMSIAGAAPFAYITNYGSHTVSIVDTATNNVTSTVNVGNGPSGVAVNPDGSKVYVANQQSNTVSVIDISTNSIIATVNTGYKPWGIAVNPAGTKVYVTNQASNTVSVIDTSTNTVTATVNVGSWPVGVAVNPDGTKVYVVSAGSMSVIDTASNNIIDTLAVGRDGVAINPAGTRVYVTSSSLNTVSVIDTSTNTVTATVNVGNSPSGVAVNPDGSKIYVANSVSNTVSLIDTSTNTVIATVDVGVNPYGIAVNPAGTRVYVANMGDGSSVSVIDTLTNKVTATVNVGYNPVAFGQFIGPGSAQPVLPVANFSSNVATGYAPLTIQFTDISKNATGWYWDFGDGNNSDQQNPTHTYSEAGNYTVTLAISNAEGSDVLTKTDYIKVRIASSVKLTSITLDPENSTGATTNAPGAWTTNPADPLAQICVRNEEGILLNQPLPSGALLGEISIPLEPGINNFTLIGDRIFPGNEYYGAILFFDSVQTPPQIAVYNSNGGTGDFSVQVAGTEIIGSANGGLFLDKAPGISVYTAPDGTKVEVVSFVVDSENGITDEVSWADIGSNGYPDTVAKLSLKVTPPSIPVADFSASPTSGTAPLTVVFTDSSTGLPASWKWDFGDEFSSTDQNPTHTYSSAGTYTVSLTVSNSKGTDSKIATITVLEIPVPPVADFSASPVTGKAPLTVTFADKSTGSPTSWSWNFGDKSTSINQNPVYTYSKAGKYTVSLTVKNAVGGDTKKITNYIVVTK